MFSDGTLIICLGINLLLCGLIMYYCKQKFNSYDHKLQTMMELISALTELTEEEMSKDPTNPIQNLNATETIPVGGACGYKPFSENETTANETAANETTAVDTDTYTNIVNIDTGSNMNDSSNYNDLIYNESHNPYKDLHNLVNISANFNQSDDSLSDDSDSDSDSNNDNDNDIELNTIELSAQEGEEQKESINYDNLTVLELRTIVKNNNLSTHSTRLKRVELLDLLK